VIRTIELTNFKCFEREDIPFGALTLATGVNGSGKSSLIQSLLLLRQSHAQGLLQHGKLALNGDLVQLGAGHDAFYEAAEDDVMSLGLTWTDGVSARWQFAYDKQNDQLRERAAEVPPGALQRPPLEGEFQYLTAERSGPRALFGMSDFTVEQERQLGYRGEYAAHFLARFGRTRAPITSIYHPPASSEFLLDQVEAWLGEVSPGVRLHVEELRALDAVRLAFSFAGPHGPTGEYRPTNVGFGLTYTLSIIVAALSARPGSLLILENPEAHLHPRGQVRLARLLASAAAAGVQVIIETHSDHVLNGLRLAVRDKVLAPEATRIHFFERRVTPERIYHTFVSPQVNAAGRIDPWPRDFFDEWELALTRLIEPGGGEP